MINHTDIFIIGGGINGVSVAADAAGRGLTVKLCEKNDLGSGTSSASSKLIHGGLRYLEYYEFGLVKKALQEREILLFRAPFLVTPLEFVLPHEKHLRPAWMIRAGLFLYDHLSKRKSLPASKSVSFKTDLRGVELKSHLKKGFSYYDCFTDDSRLVILNAISAKEHGAIISPNTEFVCAEREKNAWKITLKDKFTQEKFYHYSKVLINISGPWILDTHGKIMDTNLKFKISLDKGSHIVVPKLYEGDFAYILQNHDKRIIFTIPYLHTYTLIGTTDIHYTNDLDKIKISAEEEDYLCSIVSHYFKNSITKNDIIWSYAGVRCLQAQSGHSEITATRDFQCLVENKHNLPLLTIIGGKLTTHRILAEKITDQLKSYFPKLNPGWTATTPLPGGNMTLTQIYQLANNKYTWLPRQLASRYMHLYGSRIDKLLANTHGIDDLGLHFSHGLYQKEVEYLINEEWASSVEDILWRRTKLGLLFSEEEKNTLQAWLQTHSY